MEPMKIAFRRRRTSVNRRRSSSTWREPLAMGNTILRSAGLRVAFLMETLWFHQHDYWFAAADVSATHEKFAVLFVSPVPLYFATWGYGHNGRVLST